MHPAVFRETCRHDADISPPVGPDRGNRHVDGPQHQVRLPEHPSLVGWELERRRHVGRIALGNSVVHPGLDLGQLFVAEGVAVLESLDSDTGLNEERGHGAHAVPDGRAIPDARGVAPRLLVRGEGHGRPTAGPVAILAAPLENGRNVLGERDVFRIDTEVSRREQIGRNVADTAVAYRILGGQGGRHHHSGHDRKREPTSGGHHTLPLERSKNPTLPHEELTQCSPQNSPTDTRAASETHSDQWGLRSARLPISVGTVADR